MYKPEGKIVLPPRLVEKSLQALVNFGAEIIPVVGQAVSFVGEEIGRMPPGAMRHFKAENQAAPSMIRMRTHQLLEGINTRALKAGEPPITRKHIRNAAVCLTNGTSEYRLYKHSNYYKIKATGRYQQNLINQTTYFDWVRNPSLFHEGQCPLLNGIITYSLFAMEITAFHALIPAGFDVDGNAVIVKSTPISLVSEMDLDGLVTFSSTEGIQILPEGDSLLLSVSSLLDEEDPYENSIQATNEPESQVLGQMEMIFGPNADVESERER